MPVFKCKMRAVQLALICTWVFGISCVRADCQFGSDVSEASVDTSLRGQLVDLDNPLTCSGSIVAWHYCFYTDNIMDLEEEEINVQYTSYFRVYRNISATELQRVHDVETSLPLTERQVRRDSFLCYGNMLEQDQYLDVLEGDILAAYLPTLFPPLLLVGTDTQRKLYFDTRIFGTPFAAQTLPRASLAAINNRVIHLYADVVGTTQVTGTGQSAPTSMTTSPPTFDKLPPMLKTIPVVDSTPINSILPVTTTTSMSEPTPTSVTSVLDQTTLNPIMPFTSATISSELTPNAATSVVDSTPINPIQASTLANEHSGGTPFQTSTAQPTDVIFEVESSSFKGLNTVGVVAIAVAGVLFLTVIFLTMAILIVSLKRQGKSRDKEKYNSNNQSLDYSVYEQPSADSNDGPTKIQKGYEVPAVSPQVISTDQPYSIDIHGYHVLEPRAQNSNGAIQRAETVEMHYEQATAEVFHIYANATHPTSADVTSRIRKIVSSLERTTAIPYCVPASEEQKIYQQLFQHRIRIIPSHKIQIMEPLGSGQFSEVEKAQWISDNGRAEVAVKTLYNHATSRSKIRCLQEAAMMAQFHHPNVVTLHGIIRESDKISLVMEFLVNGDLRQYLLKMRRRYDNPRDIVEANTAQLLLSYSQQIALGMLYLSDKGFVHRDLAARNVFVSDGDICKVGDFGMSRDLANAEYYVSEGGTIPVKWTAPEALYYRKYSTSSDVWSFGCLLYEIWSMGHKPFVNTFNADVLRKLSTGYRLPPPPGCPHDIYKVMMECWNPSPDSRPGFQDVLVSLLEDEQQVLAIPIDDASTCHLASCLGASLKAGYKMYPYLQGLYKSTNTPSFKHPTNDPTSCPNLNKHGMVYVEEKTPSLQEHRYEFNNTASVNPVPQERYGITSQNGYACANGRMENGTNTEYSNSYNSQEAPLLTSFPQSVSFYPPNTTSNGVHTNGKTGHF